MTLNCDMEKGCTGPVTYVDNKGYVYCTVHGCMRRSIRPCRKLTAAELAKLANGEPIAYERAPNAVARATRPSLTTKFCALPDSRSAMLIRKSLGTLIREELERRGWPVLVEVDQAPPACGALRYTIDGEKLSPGQAAERLGIVWP